ncbi:MAG: winged helix-turn-helix domain-containing protein [Spirochaetales bacterium]|nr:winged helix-turn-helix domain-containing protein [Spirochaetales bacterium]
MTDSTNVINSSWTFLTNHSHVLLCLALDKTMIMREIALKVGITERAVQQIIADLAEEGYIDRVKVGRSNRYRIHMNRHLRHPIEEKSYIRDLIWLIIGEDNSISAKTIDQQPPQEEVVCK